MLEVPHPCKNHRDTMFVGGVDHFLVSYGTAGLNDGRNSGFCSFVDVVPEGEKSVRSQNSSFGSGISLLDTKFDGIHTAHLSGSHPDCPATLRQDDGIGFHM